MIGNLRIYNIRTEYGIHNTHKSTRKALCLFSYFSPKRNHLRFGENNPVHVGQYHNLTITDIIMQCQTRSFMYLHGHRYTNYLSVKFTGKNRAAIRLLPAE